MPNIFKDGGGAGIGSYVIVFRNGALAPETDALKLRKAYEAGEQIYVSIDDEETKDSLIPASGWIDGESKLHLAARDFDDDKTYVIAVTDSPIASEAVIEAEVEEGIDIGGEEIPSQEIVEETAEAAAEAVRPYFDGNSLAIPEQAEDAPATVNSIKQGDAVVPMVDSRLPQATQADNGKVVKVNEQGSYALGADAGGVTEERVQEMIDAAIGDAINASY